MPVCLYIQSLTRKQCFWWFSGCNFSSKLIIWQHILFTCLWAKSLSCVRLFVTPWTAARQAPLPLAFSRQEHWSGLLCPPPRDLPDPRVQTHISYVFALAGRFFTTIAAWEVKGAYCLCFLLRRHMVSGLTANSLIHLSLFLYMVWGSSPVWFFCM